MSEQESEQKNRLAGEKSPYLRQHAENPVDWYPWGEEAFRKARKEDKPLFVSIGYSTCHWCHVMAHESFEDPEVARKMNEAFVNVKVDREERPDVDQTYMLVCQMMTGQGGWPLNVLLTPGKEPFYAATYLPKRGRGGRPGMLELVPWIADLWENERQKVLDSAENITGAYREGTRGESRTFDYGEALESAWEQYRASYEPEYGGFGDAPKFPSSHNLMFLLRHGKRTGREEALRMAEHTLERMRLGGLWDHVGFGFHRYSTDRRWVLPHFEKMLYDQAMMMLAYTEGWQATGRELFRQTAQEIMAYLEERLLSPQGGFYSAEDADSGEGEGAYYTWSVDEISNLLSAPDAALFMDLYRFHEEGNFREEATGEKTGRNIPWLEKPLPEIAEAREEDPADLAERLQQIRSTLRSARRKREQPGLDNKILTDWNGLAVAALARAGAAFDSDKAKEMAAGAADFLWEELGGGEGSLRHRWCEGESSVRANADDYAFLSWGLMELYEATLDPEYLGRAKDLLDRFVDACWDEEEGGFYFTGASEEVILSRSKEFYDGAMPSGNSAAVACLIRMSRMTAEEEWETKARQTISLCGENLEQAPTGFGHLLQSLEYLVSGGQEIIIAGDPGDEEVETFLREMNRHYLPHRVLLVRSGEELDKLAPFLEKYPRQEGRPTFYICENHRCERPVNDPGEAMELLL